MTAQFGQFEFIKFSITATQTFCCSIKFSNILRSITLIANFTLDFIWELEVVRDC